MFFFFFSFFSILVACFSSPRILSARIISKIFIYGITIFPRLSSREIRDDLDHWRFYQGSRRDASASLRSCTQGRSPWICSSFKDTRGDKAFGYYSGSSQRVNLSLARSFRGDRHHVFRWGAFALRRSICAANSRVSGNLKNFHGFSTGDATWERIDRFNALALLRKLSSRADTPVHFTRL